MSTQKEFRIYKTDISVFSETDRPQKGAPWLKDPDYETYNRILLALQDIGFNVHKDPRIEKDYKCLSKWHDAGERGLLQFKSEVYPIGCKFEFYQNVVFENRSGGYYDFDKLEKMPYLIRKAFDYTAIKVTERLQLLGFHERYRTAESPNPDPLRYFNDTWDDEYNRKRGDHRFQRGPDGWPIDNEFGCYNSKDQDGTIINQGCIRYYYNYNGHLMRGRAYGGVNGMWLFVYGPGKHDWTQVSASSLFSADPRALPRRDWVRGSYGRSALARMRQEKNKASRDENFERAAQIRDAIQKHEKVAA